MDSTHSPLIRLPQLPSPLSGPTLPFPSKTTRSPISFIARERSPSPFSSPTGNPESSNSALKDSKCGSTNSSKIGNVDAVLGGCLNDCSRTKVLNVGFRWAPPDICTREIFEGVIVEFKVYRQTKPELELMS